jgi:hypothetical protein
MAATMFGAPLPSLAQGGPPLGIPMDRMGSGTTWIPDAVSLPSTNFAAGGWDLMLHGSLFFQYDKQGGPRGAEQFGSLSDGMLMATRTLGGGQFQLRSMLSLDVAGVTDHGYPLLLQNGETFRGAPLVDRQHPHAFFMELGAMYDRAVSKDVGVELYAGPAGEPALGPVAFMHRPSQMDNPAAPIGHHWQDATHVSFGVATAGVFTRHWKIEGSMFNGRDSDKSRWEFDFHPLQSYSGRLTFSPDSQWSLSAGFGFLKSPETADAGHSMHSTVFAAQHGKTFGPDAQWATTFIWSSMSHSDELRVSHSALVESELVADRNNTVFARAEFVQKSVDDLDLPVGAGAFVPDRLFDVGELTLGYVRELGSARGATLGLGVMGMVNTVPAALQPFYGSRTPLGGMVFIRIRALRSAGGMAGMPGMKMIADR